MSTSYWMKGIHTINCLWGECIVALQTLWYLIIYIVDVKDMNECKVFDKDPYVFILLFSKKNDFLKHCFLWTIQARPEYRVHFVGLEYLYKRNNSTYLHVILNIKITPSGTNMRSIYVNKCIFSSNVNYLS